MFCSNREMSRSHGIAIAGWIYLIIMNGDAVRGQVAGPNAVVLISGQTMLDCHTTVLASSSWSYTPDGTTNPLAISNGCNPPTGSNSAYYRVEQPGGNICRLIIANATMQQAGVYECYSGPGGSIYRSLVTVIDPLATVVVYNRSEVVDGDKLNISCSINYSGPASPAPSLRPSPYWTTSPGQIFANTTYYTSTSVTLTATVTVQKYTIPIFQCNTVFEITGNTSGYNSTAPAGSFTVGGTKEIDVQYPVETINISSTIPTEDNCVSKPENLTCAANANPPAQYMWHDPKNNTNTIGVNKSISSGGEFQCFASNSIRNQAYNETKNVIVTSCYPVYNLTMSGSNCANNSCTCSGNQSSFILSCAAIGNPEPKIEWRTNVNYHDFGNGTIEATVNGQYDCIASNVYGGIKYNATSTEPFVVTYCTGSSSLLWLLFLIYPGVGWILGVIFAIYYGKSDKKSTYNKHFPFLEKMLPCMNPNVNATTFKRIGWITLYILMVTTIGVFIIPIMVIKVQFCKTKSVDINSVGLGGPEAHPGNEATPSKETIVDEKTNEETVTKKVKKKKKKKKSEVPV